jgi:hypothetical protein
MVGYEKRMQ